MRSGPREIYPRYLRSDRRPPEPAGRSANSCHFAIDDGRRNDVRERARAESARGGRIYRCARREPRRSDASPGGHARGPEILSRLGECPLRFGGRVGNIRDRPRRERILYRWRFLKRCAASISRGPQKAVAPSSSGHGGIVALRRKIALLVLFAFRSLNNL